MVIAIQNFLSFLAFSIFTIHSTHRSAKPSSILVKYLNRCHSLSLSSSVWKSNHPSFSFSLRVHEISTESSFWVPFFLFSLAFIGCLSALSKVFAASLCRTTFLLPPTSYLLRIFNIFKAIKLTKRRFNISDGRSFGKCIKNNVSTPLFSLQYYQTEKNYKNNISFF